ncbi:MAG: hypothetical protein PCFJNLEI_01300 [Verrucomicrobiae bacterium]|nr:hypothetical protein [Verrucomicrobiae bacterium]
MVVGKVRAGTTISIQGTIFTNCREIVNRQLTVVLCCLALLIALGAIWVQLRPAVDRIPRAETVGTQTGLGRVLGEEAAKVATAQGRVVVIIPSNPVPIKQRLPELWNALEDELKKHNLSLTVVECPLNAWETGSLQDDRAAFNQVLEQNAGADVLIFLTDLLEWGRAQEALPQQGIPKIIAVDNLKQRTKIRYSGFFNRGVLVALIGARSEPRSAVTAKPQTPREWFDLHYRVYTAADSEALPE